MPLSPQHKARLTGLFWLSTIVAGFMALSLQGTMGIAANVVASLTYIGASYCAYELLKHVNKNLALVSAFFGILGCLIGAERMFIKILPPVSNLGFLFFGSQCILVGYLIVQSTYLPRWVGFLLSFGGMGWLVYGLTSALALPIARSLSPYIMIPGILGETCLTMWLLVKGVNEAKWEEKAGS